MKQITVEDFDKAVPEVAAEITMEHKDDGAMEVILFSMSGVAFASALRKKLFEQQEEEKEDK